MNMLKNEILRLKQEVSGISVNPVLDAFILEECEQLDNLYQTDAFVKEKVDSCLNYLSDLSVDFNAKYKAAYEEYSEANIYLVLKTKFLVDRIPETTTPTPDFHIQGKSGNPLDINGELKSLSFLDGNLNYKGAQKSGLKSRISSEEQISQGKNIAFGETIISPFLKRNKLPTTKELIEIYIDKITQNLKEGQFSQRDTILIVDIKQLLLGSHWDESAVPIYQEKMLKSMASGVLWNTAFGKVGATIFKPIEFEGKENIDDELSKNGILIEHDFVKGIIFYTYKDFHERKLVGFLKQEYENSTLESFFYELCDFYNDEFNTNGWRVLQK